MDWISAHVFYHDWPDAMLRGCVSPLVARLREEGSVQRFFFVRYADGGPHVRLRFGGSTTVLEREVRPRVDAWLAAYLRANPAGAGLASPGTVFGRHEAPAAWTANNTWCWVAYEREWSRYGGPVAMDIAEQHFDFSSGRALEVISRDRELDLVAAGRARRGAAFRIMVVMMQSMGGSIAAGGEFFRQWAASVCAHCGISGIGRVLEQRYHAQREQLCRQAAAVLDRRLDAESSLHGWRRHCEELAGRLRSVEADGGVGGLGEARLYGILGSYLHMHNNRLGIFGDSELLLAYLVARSLQSLTGSERG